MAPTKSREEILSHFRTQIQNGQIIVGAGAGIGLSAKFIEQGGGDLIIIYNSGRYRMAGRGSLAGLMPYGNANDVVLEMASPPFGVELTSLLSNTRQEKFFLLSSIRQSWLESVLQTRLEIWTGFWCN